MRHDFLDRYSRISSPVHDVGGDIKIVATFSTIVVSLAVPLNIYFHISVAIILISAAIASRIPALYMIRRLLFLEPFVLGVSLLALFQQNGVSVFLNVVAKSTISLFAVILFSNTTPFAELLSFMRKIGFPSLLITVLALMYRYLFVLIDETERMERARESRSFVKSQRSVWKNRGTMIGQLFIRSTERADRIYAAMRSRGWK